MTNWLVENKIVDHLFDKKHAHDALIKKSKVVLEFLSRKNGLTVENADAIWQCTQVFICFDRYSISPQDKYLGAVTCEVVKLVAYRLHGRFVEAFWAKIASLPTAAWTTQMVQFTYDFYVYVFFFLSPPKKATPQSHSVSATHAMTQSVSSTLDIFGMCTKMLFRMSPTRL